MQAEIDFIKEFTHNNSQFRDSYAIKLYYQGLLAGFFHDFSIDALNLAQQFVEVLYNAQSIQLLRPNTKFNLLNKILRSKGLNLKELNRQVNQALFSESKDLEAHLYNLVEKSVPIEHKKLVEDEILQQQRNKLQHFLRLKREVSENQRLAKRLAQKIELQEQQMRQKAHIVNKQEAQRECVICMMQLYQDQIMPLECQDVFHQNCLHNYLTVNLNEKKLPLICPLEKCKKQICINDLKQVLTQQEFIKFQNFSLSYFQEMNNKQISWCPTADCKFMFEYQPGSDFFKCPLCKKEYCLQCKSSFHKNFTCQQNKKLGDKDFLDDSFKKFVHGSKFKACPKCNIWVERIQGCDSMSCRCGCFFCYKCGDRQQVDHGPCSCTNPRPRPRPQPRVPKKK